MEVQHEKPQNRQRSGVVLLPSQLSTEIDPNLVVYPVCDPCDGLSLLEVSVGADNRYPVCDIGCHSGGADRAQLPQVEAGRKGLRFIEPNL
jgi:hypothetical protein